MFVDLFWTFRRLFRGPRPEALSGHFDVFSRLFRAPFEGPRDPCKGQAGSQHKWIQTRRFTYHWGRHYYILQKIVFDFCDVKSLRWHVCRVNFARKIFFELRILLRKMLRNFPRNFWAFVLWVRKNPRKIPSKFPTKFSKFPCEKSKKIHRRASAGAQGEKIDCVVLHQINSIRFLLMQWIASMKRFLWCKPLHRVTSNQFNPILLMQWIASIKLGLCNLYVWVSRVKQLHQISSIRFFIDAMDCINKIGPL